MRLIFTSILIFFFLSRIQARFVEFSVNMNNDSISANGIHVTGDFQIAAGFTGGNWNPTTTVLTQIGTTGIYHVFVNIPAKKKYEYKYVNGDQFYESEYVPEESRVGYLFNDNRWFYLDSLTNDTLKLPALIFSTNAALNQKLLRFKVGMTGFLVNTNGVHVAGTHNNFDPETNYMYSFDGKIYEYITYIDTLAPSAEYRFINGNTSVQYETVPGACSFASNRKIVFTRDTVLPVVCFSSCSPCITGIDFKSQSANLTVFPNPIKTSGMITFRSVENDVYLYDVHGKLIREFLNTGSKLVLEKGAMSPGFYFLVTDEGDKLKLVIE